MKKRGTILALTLTLVLAMLLGTCSGIAEGETQHLRFSWWGGDARHEARLKVIKMFEEQNPGVVIDAEYGGFDGYYQKITTMLAAGTEPDIMVLSTDWLQPLGKSGSVFYDLETQPDWLDLSGFNQDVLSGILSVNGKVQSLPISASNGNIYVVNTDFMEKFGVEADHKWTWDDMTEIGERIHKEDPSSYLTASFGPESLIHLLKYYVIQHGDQHGWITSDYELEFTEQDLIDGLTYFRSWIDKGVMQPVEETVLFQSPLENPDWLGGNVGMVNVFSSQTTLAVTDSLNLDVAAMPYLEGTEDYGVTAGPAGCIMVSANTKYPETALRFLDFFFNNMEAVEVLNTTHGMQPILSSNEHLVEKGLLKALDFKADMIVTETRSPKFNLTWQAIELETPYRDYISAVLFGTLTPEQAGARMYKEISEAAALLKGAI